MRYRSIQSLKEYWTISSYEYRLQKFLKSEVDESWVLSETINPNDVVRISSLDVLVSLAEVYEGVKF
jgi:Uma2 family endonuclease